MGLENENRYIINLNLMWSTGLYQMLDPNTPRRCFGMNAYRLVGFAAVLYLAMVLVMCHASAYRSANDAADVFKYAMLAVATLFALMKMRFVVNNSDALWRQAVGFTAVDLLSGYGGHRKDVLAAARAVSLGASRVVAAAWVAAVAVWIASPVAVGGAGGHVSVLAANGTVDDRYRYNMLNLLFPVTGRFYDDHFRAFYALETVALLCYGYSMMSFDCLAVSVCITAAYQLKTIALSYAALGHRAAGDRHYDDGKGNNSLDEESNDLNNLKLIIKDHQKFIKRVKMHEVYDVLRPILLFQLSIESMLITLQPFLTVLNLNKGMSLTSPESVKLISSAVTNIVHLFMTCYLFSMINKCKDSINFALYNCNWTEMNIGFKKLLLLTMRANNIKSPKLKVTAQMIVNMELFANVIHTTYKIMSVLVNHYTNI